MRSINSFKVKNEHIILGILLEEASKNAFTSFATEIKTHQIWEPDVDIELTLINGKTLAIECNNHKENSYTNSHNFNNIVRRLKRKKTDYKLYIQTNKLKKWMKKDLTKNNIGLIHLPKQLTSLNEVGYINYFFSLIEEYAYKIMFNDCLENSCLLVKKKMVSVVKTVKKIDSYIASLFSERFRAQFGVKKRERTVFTVKWLHDLLDDMDEIAKFCSPYYNFSFDTYKNEQDYRCAHNF